MFKEFTRADKDKSGALSIEEFFGCFELTFVTPLAKRAFYAFDLDGSGELDYGEFTVIPIVSNFAHAQLLLQSIIFVLYHVPRKVSLWNFLSITMADLGGFFFEVWK